MKKVTYEVYPRGVGPTIKNVELAEIYKMSILPPGVEVCPILCFTLTTV